MGVTPSGDFDPAFARLIKCKVAKYGFNRDEREDAEQDLWVHLISGMRRHDPARASRLTFANQIVTSKLNTMRQRERSQKRDRRRLVRAGDHGADLVDPTDLVRSQELRLDMQSALSGLPAEQLTVAALLAVHTESDVIRLSGLSRQKVRGIKSKLAKHLKHLRE
jgi:DNA-directed RNA polymerase specialized sigma24 family protein